MDDLVYLGLDGVVLYRHVKPSHLTQGFVALFDYGIYFGTVALLFDRLLFFFLIRLNCIFGIDPLGSRCARRPSGLSELSFDNRVDSLPSCGIIGLCTGIGFLTSLLFFLSLPLLSGFCRGGAEDIGCKPGCAEREKQSKAPEVDKKRQKEPCECKSPDRISRSASSAHDKDSPK